MKAGDFDRNVFINCPYSPDYRKFLWAIVFVVARLGFEPKTAAQESDSGDLRMEKIKRLIETCRHGIHDLSRVISAAAGEPARMNMPYELGIDLGARWFGKAPLDRKVTLILEKTGGSVKRALSDLGGNDPRTYSGKVITLIGQIRQHFYAFISREPGGVADDFPTTDDLWEDWNVFNSWLQQRPDGKTRSAKELRKMEISEFTNEVLRWIKSS